MKYIFWILSIFLTFTIWNCNKPKTINDSNNFEATKNYSAKRINYKNEDLILGFPSKLIVVDSAIVVLSNKSSNFLTILDIKNGEIFELGNKGKGPGELVAPINLTKNQAFNKCFDIFDFAKKEIFTYNIDSCRIQKINTGPLKSDKIINGTFKCYSLTDSTFLNTGLFDDQFSFRLSNKMNRTITQFGDYDYDPNDKNTPMNKCLAYQGNASVQDTNIVWACSNAQIIEIFTIRKNNEIASKKRVIKSLVEYSSENQGKGYSSALKQTNKLAYCDITTSSLRIYLLYSGKASSEYKNMTDIVKCPEIHVFDWNGNFLERMVLDKEVVNIAVSEVDNKLFAIIHEPEPQIVYFQL